MRTELFSLGISQTSAGSRVAPGSYGREEDPDKNVSGQFEVADHRSPSEVIRSICELGYLPSFCTACYRRGRTGREFMKMAKPGEIHELCSPNGILTFKEYLMDYAPAEVYSAGEKALARHLEEVPGPLQKETRHRLRQIEEGERDLYF